MSIQAVCFDLGGVVARISTRWFEILTRLGYSIPDNIHPDSDLSDMKDFDPYQAGAMTTDAYLQKLAVYIGGSVDQARQVHDNILIEPYPGVLEVVRELNAKGVLTGCLSNTNPPHWIQLSINGRFQAVVEMKLKLASYEIAAYKPDARAYRLFEAVSGFSGRSVLLFDDNPHNCQAAAGLGWQVVNIDPQGDTASQMRAALGLAP